MPKSKPTKKPATKAKPAKKATKRKANPALMKPVQPDAALAVIVGSKPLARGPLTKKLWDYIKKNKLQDAKKKTMINADDALKVIFGGKKQVSMFEMTKLVSKHVKA
jgi:chromatin remodeling complex protein RSC6